MDLLSLSNNSVELENLHEVEQMAMKDADAAVQAKQLSELIGARAVTLQALCDLHNMYLDTDYSNDSIHELLTQRDAYERAYNGDVSQVTGDAKIFKEQVDTIREGAMSNLQKSMDLARDHNEKAKVPNQPPQEGSTEVVIGPIEEDWKNLVCRCLATGIVVKESRIRYQKEQFDRYQASIASAQLVSKHLTLREFAGNYATLIDIMTDSSHSFVCPKIEANYDQFD